MKTITAETTFAEFYAQNHSNKLVTKFSILALTALFNRVKASQNGEAEIYLPQALMDAHEYNTADLSELFIENYFESCSDELLQLAYDTVPNICDSMVKWQSFDDLDAAYSVSKNPLFQDAAINYFNTTDFLDAVKLADNHWLRFDDCCYV